MKEGKWRTGLTRVGTIARKLGHYPLWLKDGTKIDTTVLQIVDNHVVKSIPKGEFEPTMKKSLKNYKNNACVLVGSESVDPTKLAAEYIGLFKGSGVVPTRHLCRFIVSPNAILPSGTPLNVCHYRVGDHVDVRSKT